MNANHNQQSGPSNPSTISGVEMVVLKPVIRVLNKKQVGDRGEYVGRPSPLGNPFKLEGEADREAVSERFEVWLRQQIEIKDRHVCSELNRLYRLARDRSELDLVCWCAPRRCHADVIRLVLLEAFGDNTAHNPG
jgi:Domain of unknown function (DUF4326)